MLRRQTRFRGPLIFKRFKRGLTRITHGPTANPILIADRRVVSLPLGHVRTDVWT